MSKNPSILEGGHAKTASNVSRLVTSLQGGGRCYWVPEDERLLRTKYVNKNGLYLPAEDSVYAFSKMTVNVPGGAAGYDVPTVDENGTPMPSPSSPEYDPNTPTYGPVGVNTDIQPVEIPSIDGGIGSDIVGIDPDTGNRSIASVDKDGKITKKEIPASIRIKTQPRKLSYYNGQQIDFGGLVVELLKTDGTTFTDEDYPNGTIRWQLGPFPQRDTAHPNRNYELLTPITVASVSGSDARTYTNEDTLIEYEGATLNGPISYVEGMKIYTAWYSDLLEKTYLGVSIYGGPLVTSVYPVDDYSKLRITYCNDCYLIVAPFSFRYSSLSAYASASEMPKQHMASSASGAYMVDGGCYFGVIDYSGSAKAWTSSPSARTADQEQQNIATLAKYIMYGDGFKPLGRQSIPVQWESPYDMVTYDNSFSISVTQGNDGHAGDEGGDFGDDGGSF